ncbi:DUF397 domain-containing protein [Streptomyces sp. NPDC096310]|uniref:DUF397 domain-containing protein n=1 Tax=Streptomyces sp. NPDC096310 TaxID=3366082 RepID=UPI0037FF6111
MDLAHAHWRKSRWSQGDGACVEVADGFPGVVPVRDSKAPDGPALVFPLTAFGSFVAALCRGDLGYRA